MDFKKPLNMYQGLAIIGVQIVASKLFFHEAISPTQWIGMAVIIGGSY